MQKFLELQTKRRLQSHETIVAYMYSKNAILKKAPYRLAEEERISLILSGIEDDTWANPVAAQLCGTVTELIDRAALLDARRRMTVCADNDKKPPPSTTSRGQGSNQRVPASSSANLPTANSRSDSSGAPRPRPTPLLVHASTAATSVTCPVIVASRKRQQRSERTRNDIRPTLASTLDVTLGTTNVRLEDVVVTELPSGIDLILGSDWRRVASVDVTFHTSNDVTIVPVEPTGKSSSSEVPPPKQGTPHSTGETLIASFCRQSNEDVFKDDEFVRLNTKCPAPDENLFKSLVEDATRRITKDATDAERD
ncbi:hypothetical protein MTO96_048742 [Rhipicephalus appendiculatus]